MTIKLQTKLIIAFVGSTFLAVMLWDRHGGMEVDPNPLNYKEEGDDRVIHRSKRANFGAKLQNIYQKFSNAEDCCNVPSILPADALEACDNANFGVPNKKQKQKKQPKASGLNNWFNRIKKNFLPGNSKKSAKNVAKKGRQANQPQKILLSSVCYTDCVFSYMNLLNESALDLNEIEKTFLDTNTEESWANIIQDSLYTCEEPSACASPETIQVTGKFCSIKPTILMNCMRKQMLLVCPNRKNTYQCNSAVAQLKKADVLKAHQ